jgi:hypothetical protein
MGKVPSSRSAFADLLGAGISRLGMAPPPLCSRCTAHASHPGILASCLRRYILPDQMFPVKPRLQPQQLCHPFRAYLCLLMPASLCTSPHRVADLVPILARSSSLHSSSAHRDAFFFSPVLSLCVKRPERWPERRPENADWRATPFAKWPLHRCTYTKIHGTPFPQITCCSIDAMLRHSRSRASLLIEKK